MKNFNRIGWTPGANTLLYLPLENDTIDQTGNYNITNSNVTFNNCVGVFNGSNSKLVTTTNFAFSGNPAAFTISMYIYHTRNQVDVLFGEGTRIGGIQNNHFLGAYIDGGKFVIWKYNVDTNTGITINENEWTNIIMTSNGTTTKVYKNGQQGYSGNITYNIYQAPLAIGCNNLDSANYYGGSLSKFIVEDKERTAQEISNYYNQTKGNYGIS